MKANLGVRLIAAKSKGEPGFSGLHLGDVDVKMAERLVPELALSRFVGFDFRQTLDGLPLQTAAQ